ncbi:hypothetical protein MAP00_007944 [Monascus purpureus]|nr:hypothetical protein MAP00_007944 [Monascus purpureus]
MAFGTGTYWQKPHPEGPFTRSMVEFFKIVIMQGYRHFDCADFYGTEEEVGVAIQESGIPREDFYITTKVRDGMDDVEAALDRSLKRLGTHYVDLFLIYSPSFARTPQDLQHAWKEMEKLVSTKKTRSIGVSNYQREHIEPVLEVATLKPAVNQIEFHPYARCLDYAYWLEDNNIQVQGFFGLAPLNLSSGGPLDRVLPCIAHIYDVNENAVLIQWMLSYGVTSISTSRDPVRIEQYLKVTEFKLDEGLVSLITVVGNANNICT